MKQIKLGKKIIFWNFIYWIIYNTIFGWNLEPINDVEKALDFIFLVVFLLGVIQYTKPAFIAYETFIETLIEEK